MRLFGIILIILLLLLVASGCLPALQSPEQSTATKPLIISTNTIYPVTPSKSTPLTTGILVQQNCLVVQNSIPEAGSLSGYLIIDSRTGSQLDKRDIFALNLENYNKLPLLESERGIRFEPNTYTISPDGKWFVYFTKNANAGSTLHLGTIGNKNQESAYWDGNWGENAIWLNQNQLFIPPSPNSPSALVLDPFTGKWRELQSEFPSGLNFTYPFFYYSSTLSSAIYVSGDNYVLWNSKSNMDIWVKPTYAPYLAPKWSPDGSHFAMIIRGESDNTNTVHDELLLVNQQGNETRSTNFSQRYSKTNAFQIMSFEWSPDNRHIAFTLEIENNLGDTTIPTLIIVDTVSNQAFDYCIPTKNDSNLIWSPNGEQLVVETHKQNDQEGSNVVLVNVVQGWATHIADNLHPVGWMVSP